MSEWRELSVKDLAAPHKSALATGPFGSAVSSKHFVDSPGVPMIRGSNLSTDVGDRLLESDFAFLPLDLADKFERSSARSGDLVFTCWGTVGQIGLIESGSRFERYIVSNKQMKLTPDPKLVDSRFLYYALQSPSNLDQVQRQAGGSAVPGFNLGQLKEIRVSVPCLDSQRSIVDVLRSIDDLIENNRRRIEVLEEMAQAIYREWFVHFRFPRHEDATFVDSPLGPIPDGWEVSTINDITESISRGLAPKYADDGDWVAINQRCIREGRVSLELGRRQSRVPKDPKKVLNGDVLVNSTGVGTLGRVAVYRGSRTDLTADSHVTIIRPDLDFAQPWFGLQMLDRQKEFERLGAGSTGQTELARTVVAGLGCLVPPSELRKHLNHVLRAAIEMIAPLLSANDRLTATRDALLPKLVTGEIDVSELDLDSLVEAAG